MKRIILLMTVIFLAFSLCGCTDEPVKTADYVEYYTQIQGITDEEISEIEKLKTERDSLIYGTMLSTEAYVLPDGSKAGFTVELCSLLTQLFGIEFEPELYEWDELIDNLNSHIADFTGELTETEERKLVYTMSSPIAERVLNIYTQADAEKINSENDLIGKQIGFLKGTTIESNILKAYPISFTGVDIDSYEAAASMIANGQIYAFVDEAVADPALAEYGFIKSAPCFSTIHDPVSLSTANPDNAAVVSVLSKYIDNGGIDKLYEIYKKSGFEYTKFKLAKSFTDEEAAYIDDCLRSGEAVPVAFESDNYPVNFYNEKEDEFAGIAVDVLNEIGRLTGLKFKPANTKDTTWTQIYDKLMKDEVPVVAQLLHSDKRGDRFIWSNVPYARCSYNLLSRADFPYLDTYQVKRAKVGAMKGSGKVDIYFQLFPDGGSLIYYDTQNDCLDALERGEIDLLMGSEYTLITQTNYREKTGFKTNIKFNEPMESFFGFPKKETVLCSIIDKAQQYVETDDIETSWTGRYFDYSKKLAEERTRYLTVFLFVLLFLFVLVVFSLAKNVKLSKTLRDIALRDSLTGIYNRRYFMEMTLIQMERSRRTNRECFIIIVDLDHFKEINDTYGHLAGDKVLKEVALRMEKAIRPYDLFGRYGGEEFVICIPEVTKENVLIVTERIRKTICASPIDYDGKEISITASFGIAIGAPQNDIEAAIKYADEALYTAKEQGRNRVVFHEDKSDEETDK